MIKIQKYNDKTNIVCQIEDEASSESDKKVEWYSDGHDNLTDNVRLAEEKAFAK